MHEYKLDYNKKVKCNDWVLIEMDTPIKNLERLLSIEVLGSCATNLVIQYRYSDDGTTYSEWITWNDWKDIDFELTWLSFRVKSETDWTLNGIEIKWRGGELAGDCNCFVSVCREDSFLVECGGQPAEYQAASGAICLWQNQSLAIFRRFGWPVIYFKCDPVKESKDVVFREYSLLQVRECKQIKMIVDGNDFGSGDFQFTEFDIDFDDELNIQISKEMFWAAFGTYEQPAEKDFIYFPLENRMYRVNSIQEEKGFMRQSIWWKGTLVKYNESDSILKSDSIQATIDDLTLNFEDVGFTEEREIEEENIVVPQQYETRAVGYSDHVRDYINIEWEKKGVVEEQLDNYFTVFSKYHYNLAYAGATNANLIEYQKTIDTTENFSIMFWYNGKPRTADTQGEWLELFRGGLDIDVQIKGNFITSIRVQGQRYSFKLPINQWFAFYIGFNNLDNTCTVRIWERADKSKKTTIMKIFYEKSCPIPNGLSKWKPVLMSSGDRLTMFRVLKQPVAVEDQSNLFTLLVFQDEGQAHIVDTNWPLTVMERMNAR